MEKLLIYPEDKEQIKVVKTIMKALKIKFESYEDRIIRNLQLKWIEEKKNSKKEIIPL